MARADHVISGYSDDFLTINIDFASTPLHLHFHHFHHHHFHHFHHFHNLHHYQFHHFHNFCYFAFSYFHRIDDDDGGRGMLRGKGGKTTAK